jgi:hypothetical protein
MKTKREGLLVIVIALAAGLICLVTFLLLRGPSHPTVQKPTKMSRESESKRAEKPVSPPGSRMAETAPQARTSLGVLVWPRIAGRAMNYSRQILSWMKEWGFHAGFVTVARGRSVEEHRVGYNDRIMATTFLRKPGRNSAAVGPYTYGKENDLSYGCIRAHRSRQGAVARFCLEGA